MKKLLGALAVLAFAGAGSAHAGVIYSNDFESGSTAGITGVTSITTSPTGEKFLGQLDLGDSSLLTVDTSGFTNLTLKFDLYAINSLDGVGDDDNFILKINGVEVGNWLHHYSGGTTNPFPHTDTSHLGYGHFGPDRTYAISFSIANGASTTVEFIGSTNQDSSDEGFGVDNIVLSGNSVGGIPEPSTWAMMILGFGAAGAAMRRRRVAPAVA